MRRMDRQITWPDTERAEDLNMKAVGMLRVIQAFLPHIPVDGSGRIVNISGVAATATWTRSATPSSFLPRSVRDIATAPSW